LFDSDSMSPPSDANTLARMLSRSASLLQARGCGVLLWDVEKNHLAAMEPFAGLDEDQVKRLEFPVGGSALGVVVRQDRPVILSELSDSQHDVLQFKQLGVENVLGVPLALERRDEANEVLERDVMGICCAFNKHFDRDFDQEDARLLSMMARQVSAVLVTSRLYWQAVERTRTVMATLESMAVGLIAISLNHTITQANAVGRQVFGLEQDVVGHNYMDVIANEDMRLVIADSFERQEPQAREIVVKEGDRPRILRVQSEPIVSEDARPLGWVIVLEDITDIREAERMMAAFVDMVSHELRTPLTSIRGFVATLLQAGEGSFDWETQSEFLDIVDSEAERLGQMIDDLLNVARLQNGRGLQFSFQPVDLNVLIQRVVKLQSKSSYVRGHEIVVKGEDLPPIVADEGKVEQVLNNLLSNALKYSPNGGTVTIAAHLEGEGIRISIADQGMGIPKEQLPRMFQQFFRVEGSHMVGIKGTGLGLYLVKHLIDGHGGRIWVESEFGHGTTFLFWLPLDASSYLEKQKPTPVGAAPVSGNGHGEAVSSSG
jgi:two-component system, OmpR family, phosphate regulon sensor histidine kinase PhoR